MRREVPPETSAVLNGLPDNVGDALKPTPTHAGPFLVARKIFSFSSPAWVRLGSNTREAPQSLRGASSRVRR